MVVAHDPDDVLMYVALLPEDGQEPEALREFLQVHKRDLFENGHALQQTQWAKGVLLYDWLKYGRA